MMWGRCMFYWNGRPPAMGGSRGHHGGRPRCGDKNLFYCPPLLGGHVLNPPPPKKRAPHTFVTMTQCPPPTQIANGLIWGEFKPTLLKMRRIS